MVINPLSGSFINQRLTYHRRGDQKSTPHPDKLSHTITPPIYSRANLSFLKVIYSPQRCLHIPLPPSQLRWHLSQSSKPPQRVTHFSLGISHVHMRDTCLINCYSVHVFLLLICVLLQESQVRTLKGELFLFYNSKRLDVAEAKPRIREAECGPVYPARCVEQQLGKILSLWGFCEK